MFIAKKIILIKATVLQSNMYKYFIYCNNGSHLLKYRNWSTQLPKLFGE